MIESVDRHGILLFFGRLYPTRLPAIHFLNSMPLFLPSFPASFPTRAQNGFVALRFFSKRIPVPRKPGVRLDLYSTHMGRFCDSHRCDLGRRDICKTSLVFKTASQGQSSSCPCCEVSPIICGQLLTPLPNCSVFGGGWKG